MLRIEFDREDDGRWIAEIPALPGVMAYGASQKEAQAKVDALEAGHRVVDTNQAAAQVSALGVALVEVDDDPPVTTDRRRALIQQVI